MSMLISHVQCEGACFTRFRLLVASLCPKAAAFGRSDDSTHSTRLDSRHALSLVCKLSLCEGCFLCASIYAGLNATGTYHSLSLQPLVDLLSYHEPAGFGTGLYSAFPTLDLRGA